MKKLVKKSIGVILILLITILSSSGCDVNFQDKISQELENEDPLVLSLIKYLQELFIDYDMYSSTLENKIDEIKKGSQPLLVDFDSSNCYFVCGYYNSTHNEKARYCCAKDYTWIKFENESEMTEYYNGEKIITAFQINVPSSVTDIQSEKTTVPNIEHFQMYEPEFNDSLNIKDAMAFEETFIYLNSSDKSNIYHSTSAYYNQWVTIPCIYIDSQCYIVTLSYTDSTEDLNLTYHFGKYYDTLNKMMITGKYSVAKEDGTTSRYVLFDVKDFVNKVLK